MHRWVHRPSCTPPPTTTTYTREKQYYRKPSHLHLITTKRLTHPAQSCYPVIASSAYSYTNVHRSLLRRIPRSHHPNTPKNTEGGHKPNQNKRVCVLPTPMSPDASSITPHSTTPLFHIVSVVHPRHFYFLIGLPALPKLLGKTGRTSLPPSRLIRNA